MSIKLGESARYPDKYDATLLEPILRQDVRSAQHDRPDCYYGFDLWTAFELSWLDRRGVPRVAVVEFRIDANSKNIIESKSFKYYLNSYNQTVFDNMDSVKTCLLKDISEVVDGQVGITLYDLHDQHLACHGLPGKCIDSIDCDISHYQPDSSLLHVESACAPVADLRLYSHLLKSNCPVTGQPDWASVWIQYSGQKIQEASLLKYIVSFRQYEGFHERCVERIFTDLMTVFQLDSLCVYARYARRGGLDINPLRATPDVDLSRVPLLRTYRQ